MHRPTDQLEWIESDGLGGFAMGTAASIRTRRYHSLLTSAVGSPTNRMAMVKGLDAWLETPDGTFPLSTQRYGAHEAPHGIDHLVSFTDEPWPTWAFQLPNGLRVIHELVMKHGSPLVCLSWHIVGKTTFARLLVKPLLSCTPFHTLHHHNDRFNPQVHIETPSCLWWRPYEGVPSVFAAATNGGYSHQPDWYHGLLYSEERARGFDHFEDLCSPGAFRWDIAREEGVLLLSAGETEETSPRATLRPLQAAQRIRMIERARRAAFRSPLHRAGSHFLVQRGSGHTIIAGYPWFGDWGRDTFIAMRGLCLTTDQLDIACSILDQWSGTVSEGMLPNRFADQGDAPEYNSVDASLWYVIAAGEYLDAVDGWTSPGLNNAHNRIRTAVEQVVSGYAARTRFGIRATDDGLLAAGETGQQLTWMDARAHGREVTPRIGKPVEVQALWINALHIAAKANRKWSGVRDKALASFRTRFWNPQRGCLYDVVDVDHITGAVDDSIRPNQLFAIGGLHLQLIDCDRAASILSTIERDLLTPLGLRTLAPSDPRYTPRYEGDSATRDAAYHQGTVWPWLIGPYVEAVLRVRGGTASIVADLHTRVFNPLRHHLADAGLNGVSEIGDADEPHTPRGCPFQAWSVGELLRAESLIRAAAAIRNRSPGSSVSHACVHRAHGTALVSGDPA